MTIARVIAAASIARRAIQTGAARGDLIWHCLVLWLPEFKTSQLHMARGLDSIWRRSGEGWPVFRSRWTPRRPFDWGREGIR